MKRITSLILVFVSLTLVINTSCKNNEATAQLEKYQAELSKLEDNKALAERWHTDLAINRNWKVAEEILAPDIVVHMPGGVEVKGIEEVKGFNTMYAAMENLKINHHEIIAEGNYVFLRWDLSFDNNVDFMGIPPTGKRITDIGGIDQFLIENGKIKEFWQFYDELGFMKKLGVIPTE